MLVDHKGAKADAIVECDEAQAREEIDGKFATEAMESDAQVSDMVQKEIQLQTKRNKVMENKNTEYALGNMFKYLAHKSITGNSETGSAADGGALVYTGLAELAPLVMQNSVVYSKCRKIPVSKSSNAMKIPVDISDFVIKSTAPVVSNPAEGVAGSATKLQFAARTLTMVKSSIPVAVTEELLEDDASIDAFVRADLVGKLANILDFEVLASSNAATGGYTSIINDSASYVLTQALTATPTLAEVQAVVSKVHPKFVAAEWYMSITMWNLCVSTFGTAANLQNQLIDISNKKLLGKNVNVMPCLSATRFVYGDMSQYTVIESPLSDRITFSNDVRFLEGEVVYKMTHRGSGAVTYGARATADSLSVAAFCSNSTG